MSKLASVIAGLDGLSPAELEAVEAVLAAKRFASSGGDNPHTEGQRPSGGAVAALSQELVKMASIITNTPSPAVEAEDSASRDLGNPEFRAFVAKAKLLRTSSLPSGPGRKAMIASRCNDLEAAWKHLPHRIRDRFD